MAHIHDASKPPARGHWQVVVALLPLVFLWFVLIAHLRFEWAVNPQYSFGWAVPVLCAYLAWRACEKRKAESVEGRKTGTSNAQRAGGIWLAAFLFCVSLYPVARMVQEANPEWRLVSWALATIVTGLTLVILRRVFGSVAVRRFAFPVLFFWVAVPWPTVIEAPVIQNLARFNAAGAVEILNLTGTPAFRRGNIIEIGTGVVGIEDACSGIRSFQACLMIALFLGAYHRLKISRRVALVLAGFAMAILFNLGRTVLLVTVAGRQGMQAISQWHDPAGVIILVGCFLGVWIVSAMFRRRNGTDGTNGICDMSPGVLQSGAAFMLSLGLLFWLIFCEAGVELWYRSHERALQDKPSWVVKFPQDAGEFRELPFAPQTVQLLRFDEGRNAVWSSRDGMRCQAIFLRWNPGRIAVHLARSHTPEVCLTAGGRTLSGEILSRTITVDGLTLTFDVYHAAADGLRVYYCLWEDQRGEDSSATERLSYRSRLQNVIEGRRNLGQRSLEFAVWSDASEEEVLARAEEQLKAMVRGELKSGKLKI